MSSSEQEKTAKEDNLATPKIEKSSTPTPTISDSNSGATNLSTKKPSGFAAVISSGSGTGSIRDSGGDGSEISSENTEGRQEIGGHREANLSRSALIDVSMDDDPAPLLIDSRSNSPSNMDIPILQPSSSTISASPSIPAPPSLRPSSVSGGSSGTPISTPTIHSHGQAIRSASPAGIIGGSPVTTQRSSPLPVHPARHGPSIQQFHGHVGHHHGSPVSIGNQMPGIHAPTPSFPLVHPPPTTAGIVLPGTIHQHHYGLLAAPAPPFGHGGGQTIIVNQFGQPVGVVSPSPAAGPQPSVTVHGGGSGQGMSSGSQFGGISAQQAAMNRQQPVIMAYRPPGNVQQPQVTSIAHPQTNSPSSVAATNNASNASAAAAVAAMAAGMHSIPLFPNHFNPFNAPILLPGGQMVVRTPQGHLIGFQVPTMASHHPVAVPPSVPMEQSVQVQAQQHIIPLAPSQPVTKYPHVLPKLAPSTGAGVSNSGQLPQPSAPQQQQPSFTAIGPFPIMSSASVQTQIPHQQLPIAPKVPAKNVPILPIAPMGTSTIQESANESGIQIQPTERTSKSSNGSSQQESISNVANMGEGSKNGEGISKKSKNTGSKAVKSKRKDGKKELGSKSVGHKKDLPIMDDDPGPLMVFSNEQSQQIAIEVHEIFERAWANEKTGNGPPQILTHVIDGYVIQESMDPFPISPHPFDDFNISSVVMTTDSLSEWSAPPQLSPACGRISGSGEQTVAEIRNRECPNCGQELKDMPYRKDPNYCSKFCLKAHQKTMQSSSISPGTRHASTSSIAHSSASSVQSPITGVSPKMGSPREPKKEKIDDSSIQSSSTDLASDGLLRMASPASNAGSMDKAMLGESSAGSVLDKNPEDWTVEDVYNWIMSLDASVAAHASAFRLQEIDGQALLLLDEDHLQRGMGIKFGPALKMCAALKNLRRRNR